TWVNGNSGLSGVVSSANSLVGSRADDSLTNQVLVLTNGNYVVANRNWDNGAIGVDAGAVTWASGSSGISGVISPANSLVGVKNGDQVGRSLTLLTNGNYVVCSPLWDRDGAADAGAATWAKGNSGLTGAVSLANSLIGSSAQDQVCSFAVALSNGHYVVASPDWNNGSASAAGAATWGNGEFGTSGEVSIGNSFVGVSNDEHTGAFVSALTNGNYVVTSPDWDNGAVANAGAATLLNGNGPATGSVSPAISLVGSTAQDRVGQSLPQASVVALANGHYVVLSERWDNGATADAGAVTWGSGVSGVTGTISPANSLVGTSSGDRIGSSGVVALTNGNYVVTSGSWDNGAVVNAGAATWGNGSAGSAGPVSIANSPVGSSSDDAVGSGGVLALTNGHYVVLSAAWDNGALDRAGAVTWGNGSTGITGVVSPANSLVGSSTDDQLGAFRKVALANGNYVIGNPVWDNGALSNAGAATWGNGSGGTVGALSAANSLVGSSADDLIGNALTAFADGSYATYNGTWDNGGMLNAGAATLGLGGQPLTGPVTPSNSVIGGVTGSSGTIDYDPARLRLAVGRPGANIVSLLTVDLPDALFGDGFE
ncbi:MAG: hypothetical protein KDI56_09815, partial [Xanthomonadales bacterium]|nr:hypothetical protein [Xanthomonadales bacterium]